MTLEFLHGNAYILDCEDYHQWLCIIRRITVLSFGRCAVSGIDGLADVLWITEQHAQIRPVITPEVTDVGGIFYPNSFRTHPVPAALRCPSFSELPARQRT